VSIDRESFTVGVLVQANYGVRAELRIAGVPVGRALSPANSDIDQGSILIAVATDAPLLPTQLKRLARRAALGLARNGSYSGNGSGDLFVAFSTANESVGLTGPATLRALGHDQLDPLFLATVQAVEESIVNALFAAETMTGIRGARADAIDARAVRELLVKHGRIAP
jgi:D-aminopeptidase